jgi:hypothetical protein
MNPFDFVNAINSTKQNLIVDEATEKAYVPFIVNRALSYFYETLDEARYMNMSPHLDKKLQFEYLLNSVRRAKRYSKWSKKKEDKDLELVQEYYGYNHQRAKEALSILSKKQLSIIKEKLEKGG